MKGRSNRKIKYRTGEGGQKTRKMRKRERRYKEKDVDDNRESERE